MKENKPNETKLGQQLITALDEITSVDSGVQSVERGPVEAPKLSETLLGIYKDYNTGEWMVAKAKYNPITGAIGELERISAGPGRDFGIEKFKLVAVEEGLVG